MNRKKIITICSSASFYKDVINLESELISLGFLVKIPETARKMQMTGNFSVKNYKTWYRNSKDYYIKTKLMNIHFKKVVASNAILVVNKDKNGVKGYIGGNTLMEMALAYYFNKTIYLLNDIGQGLSIEEEIRGLNPNIPYGDLRKIVL